MSTPASHPYRRPVLCVFFLIAAAGAAVGAAASVVVMLSPGPLQNPAFFALIANGSAFLAALAVVSLLESSSKAAHYAAETHRLLRVMQASETLVCPNCSGHISVRTTRPGQNTCPHCDAEFTAP